MMNEETFCKNKYYNGLIPSFLISPHHYKSHWRGWKSALPTYLFCRRKGFRNYFKYVFKFYAKKYYIGQCCRKYIKYQIGQCTEKVCTNCNFSTTKINLESETQKTPKNHREYEDLTILSIKETKGLMSLGTNKFKKLGKS